MEGLKRSEQCANNLYSVEILDDEMKTKKEAADSGS